MRSQQLRKIRTRPAFRAWLAAVCFSCPSLLLLLIGQDACALSFDVRQISDDAAISRDPSISDADLVSWVSSLPAGGAPGLAQVTVFKDNKRQELPNPEGGTTSVKPQTQSNAVVWIGNYTNILGDVSERLTEAPNRDQGAEELRALYTAEVDADGKQKLVVLDSRSNQFQTILLTNADGTVTASNRPEIVTITNEIRRHPSGSGELVLWSATGTTKRLTHDHRDDYSPSVWNGQVTWQKAKGWPFGWEIFYWQDGVAKQLTTNFYYDMAPKVQGRQVVWYGWDGHDFEIFLYDRDKDLISQITSNRYDDVSPVIWNGLIAWEGYQSAEAEIYVSREGKDASGQSVRTIKKVSDNVEDDINPRVWNGLVVWQGFDGDDFEIYLHDGEKTRKVTANNYDDTNPDIRDGIVTWQGYKDNWDAEIFAWDTAADPVQITENDDEDRDPRTAAGRIVWQQDTGTKSRIFLATPK